MSKLRRDIDSTGVAIESLLDEYGLFIDHDMAGVISSYVRALQLDFELALSRGSGEELVTILEDMLELHSDTRERLVGERMQSGMNFPLQS
ncbi:MAG: hypothetical protein WD273_07055 [Trueperaceae bacterium]